MAWPPIHYSGSFASTIFAIQQLSSELCMPRRGSQHIIFSFCFRMRAGAAATGKAMVACVSCCAHIINLAEAECIRTTHTARRIAYSLSLSLLLSLAFSFPTPVLPLHPLLLIISPRSGGRSASVPRRGEPFFTHAPN